LPLWFFTGTADLLIRMSMGALAKRSSETVRNHRNAVRDGQESAPETAVLIHGNAESTIVWYAWMPRMAQEFRVLRPDLPGLGRSRIPAGFEWSLPSLASIVAHVLD
jgi:pimeloyl-ACP methyl ester carboxylesterase